jgi:hypothetical protein
METLSQAQIDRITLLTNTRGVAFSYPGGGGTVIQDPYSFVSTTILSGNHLQIVAQRARTGGLFAAKLSFHPPLADPPDDSFDTLVNNVLDLIERQMLLKPAL